MKFKQKEVIANLKQYGYATLSMLQQVSFFSQSATDIFNRSIDKMINETIKKNEADRGQ